jgi:RHS repeat-associated protein
MINPCSSAQTNKPFCQTVSEDHPMPAFRARRSLPHAATLALLGVTLFTPALVYADSPTVSQLTYDAGDNVVTAIDPRGLVTTYTHDGLGLLWRQASPDTGTTQFGYDIYGRQSSMTRANGVQTIYGYDGIDRPTTVSVGGVIQTMAYDNCTNGIGRLCSDGDANGVTSYSYTPEGWVASKGFSIGGTTYAIGYAYGGMGRLQTVTYPDGIKVNYTQTAGDISSVTVTVTGTTVNVATAITYSPMDMAMSGWTSSNGLTNALSYDSDGRLTGISVPGKQSLGFTYDSANRINQIANGIDNTLTQSFRYDAMSRLTSVASGADNESYQYDSNGNRITATVNGSSQIYTVSPTNNQLTKFSSGLSATYGYDAQGNTTLVNGAATFQYDSFNRLASAGGVTNYINPEGQRLRKTGGATGTTYFAPNKDGGLMAENDNGTWVDYVWLNGRLIGRVSGGQVAAIHADQVGRPEVVSDASQNVIWRAQNFPFTQNVIIANISLNLGFLGQYYDAETWTWNNGYRDYNSGFGRYLESDPIGLNGGVNTYIYAMDNPITGSDALGLCNCQVNVTVTAVGPNQAKGDGALFSNYPAQAGGSIPGGTMGTVAVQRGFLGLTTRQLRTYGTQISITLGDSALISQNGGPSGALTVSDYGDSNIQATQGTAFDVYRFATQNGALQFGRQATTATINFPDGIGATCPQ